MKKIISIIVALAASACLAIDYDDSGTPRSYIKIGISRKDRAEELSIEDGLTHIKNIDSLMAKLAAYGTSNLSLVVETDPSVPCSRLLEVLSILRDRGIKEFLITSPAGNGDKFALGFLGQTNLLSRVPEPPEAMRVGQFKAVYFYSPQGAQLSEADLKAHPEVMATTNFDTVKLLATNAIAIWIDKNSAEQLVHQGVPKGVDWLRQAPQRYNLVVVVGFGDDLYSFRDLLDIANIEGPFADWHKHPPSPGFSVWSLRGGIMKGYKESPTVGGILKETNPLLP